MCTDLASHALLVNRIQLPSKAPGGTEEAVLYGCNVVVVPASRATTKNKSRRERSHTLTHNGMLTRFHRSQTPRRLDIRTERCTSVPFFSQIAARPALTTNATYTHSVVLTRTGTPCVFGHHNITSPPLTQVPEMSHATYRQVRAGSSSTSSDYEDHHDPWGDDMSELSELESDPGYTPDTDDEVQGESDDESEGSQFKVGPQLTVARYRTLTKILPQLRQSVLVRPRGCRQWYAGTVVKIREPSKEHNVSVVLVCWRIIPVTDCYLAETPAALRRRLPTIPDQYQGCFLTSRRKHQA